MIWVALAAALGWTVAAGMAGLWWGERQARTQAESWAAMGHPYGKTKATTHRTSPDPEEEAARKEFERTVDTIAESLERDLQREGREVSGQRIREEAERMAAEAGFGRRTT